MKRSCSYRESYTFFYMWTFYLIIFGTHFAGLDGFGIWECNSCNPFEQGSGITSASWEGVEAVEPVGTLALSLSLSVTCFPLFQFSLWFIICWSKVITCNLRGGCWFQDAREEIPFKMLRILMRTEQSFPVKMVLLSAIGK